MRTVIHSYTIGYMDGRNRKPLLGHSKAYMEGFKAGRHAIGITPDKDQSLLDVAERIALEVKRQRKMRAGR